MTDRFQTMKCYLLTSASEVPDCPEKRKEHVKELEKGYKHYARLFEQVHLVLDKEQGRDQYLNYPHIVSDNKSESKATSVVAVLKDCDCETVFIGSSEFNNFPLELAVDLVKKYNGEPFLGYYDQNAKESSRQPLFGIYNKKISKQLDRIEEINIQSLESLLSEQGKMLPLPEGTEGKSIGIL